MWCCIGRTQPFTPSELTSAVFHQARMIRYVKCTYCYNKKLSYRRGTARCVVSVEILPIATQQCIGPKLLVRQVLTKSMVWSWEFSWRQCVKHVHSTMTRSSRFYCLRGVINKPTTDELWISPVYRRLEVAKFSKSTMQKLLTWPWPRPLREHSLITSLRPHMADPCTKSEVSSVSRCEDITWGVKF